MSTQTTTCDVFLSYSLVETEPAQLLQQALAKTGLDVFTPERISPGEDFGETVWRALAESAAMVVVIDPRHGPTSNTAVELGAAMAWHKPIIVVRAGNGTADLPAYLKQFPVYSLARLDDVVEAVHRGLRPLSDEDLESLAAAYASLGLPVDRILTDAASVEQLSDEFERQRHRRVPGERLVSELLRLRKSKKLPRLRK